VPSGRTTMWTEWMDVRAAAFAAALLLASTARAAADSTGLLVPDRFTATTTMMTPRGVELRIDVRKWSDESSRAAVVAALSGAPLAPKGLASLPSLGYVWVGDSAVGYAVKYAHRSSTPEGERVTFVTEKRLGHYDFKPWTADPPLAPDRVEYSVIELYLDDHGRGDGALSLASAVRIDSTSSIVSLAPGAPRLLADVALKPKPYWARGK
jgi:hypothetical protein